MIGNSLAKGNRFIVFETQFVCLNCTPKVRQKKSNFWGVFIMKLTYEGKIRIYELRKQGENIKRISNFGINTFSLRYMIKLSSKKYFVLITIKGIDYMVY